ncbi:thioesterase II family protein [Saccharopolyspora shandongensis]|uniref:thioesterase II family protein n=1 Tax=Saccharopolyspora shandongensis TaxID=418495 RepID=UPI003403D2B0
MSEQRWLRSYLPRSQAEAQLICFPHAGGAMSAFRGWAELAGPSLDVLAVQYPGRQDRYADPLPADIGELADQIVPEIRPLLGRPTALFGHSMGATVAFEVARRLRPRFPSPLLRLFVSACDAPPARTPRATVRGDAEIRDYVRDLGGAAASALEDDEMWQLALPSLRHDFHLVETYRYVPGAPLTCPVTAIAGDRDETVTLADVQRWQEVAVGEFEAHSLPGGHFYPDESLPDLIALLRNRLTAARSASTT